VTKHYEGILVCKFCGIVTQSNIIDQTDERRNFSNEGGLDTNQSRVNKRGNNFISPNTDQTIISGTTKFAKELKTHNYPKENPSQKNL
jgi:transcription initiation factor TFIIIB Brf1 subunit/transcription initiation factor TFIIB